MSEWLAWKPTTSSDFMVERAQRSARVMGMSLFPSSKSAWAVGGRVVTLALGAAPTPGVWAAPTTRCAPFTQQEPCQGPVKSSLGV